MKCASFFAGVGGIDLAFEQTGAFHTVYANEFDDYAANTFETNFNIKVDRRNIREVKSDEIPDFDVMLGGFPCQAFSIAGNREGFNDKKGRGDLFFELARIIKDKYPKIIFFENVKNLLTHDNGKTFQVIYNTLTEIGYYVTYKIMNSYQYGNIPQNRERIYIIAFRDEINFKNYNYPESIPLNTKLSDIIDFKSENIDDKYFYTKSCPFFKALRDEITCHDTVYQWRRVYVRSNKNKLIPTLTANKGTGGHNVPLILDINNNIRKLTPRECFRAQGFPDTFKLPNQSDSRLYKQAGNSVSVPVIHRIARRIALVQEI